MTNMIQRAVTTAAIAAIAGCTSTVAVRPMEPAEIAQLRDEAARRVYRIAPGDTLAINYSYHPEMKQEELVRPDGTITATLVGDLTVGGLSTEQVEQHLVKVTSTQLRAPAVQVRITKFAERRIYVAGEVAKPGAVPYRVGITPLQAIAAAGGFLDTGRMDTVIFVRMDDAGHPLVNRTLDLARVVDAGQGDMPPLGPEDVLYVPRTPIANANVWVRQHITELFPFLRAGASATMPILPK